MKCEICGLQMSMLHSKYIGNCTITNIENMKEIYDTELLDLAMGNTYDLIMGDSTLKQLLEEGWDLIPFACDPHNPSRKGIENLLEYFEQDEDYEKCENILKYIKKTFQ